MLAALVLILRSLALICSRHRQSPYAERLIGSIRRDCLNHVLVTQIFTSWNQMWSWLSQLQGLQRAA